MSLQQNREPDTTTSLIERGLALGRGPSVLIGDQWEEGASDAVIRSLNPATGEVLATGTAATAAQAARAARAARVALDAGWGRTTPTERSRFIHALKRSPARRCSVTQAL